MVKSVLRVALTGGPGGGKTTFIKFFADRLSPWCVITVEESATALKAECAKAGIKHRSDSADLQQQVLHRQLHAEEASFAVAQACSKPTILLTDRGMFDSVGFVSFPTYQALLLRMTLTPGKVPSRKVTLGRFSQPNAGAFAIHVCNVEDILLKHLSAHPNLIVIDPQDTMDEKIRLTKIAVENTAVKIGALLPYAWPQGPLDDQSPDLQEPAVDVIDVEGGRIPVKVDPGPHVVVLDVRIGFLNGLFPQK